MNTNIEKKDNNSFKIKIVREIQSENNNNQLNDWRKLYEKLSKPCNKITEDLKVEDKIRVACAMLVYQKCVRRNFEHKHKMNLASRRKVYKSMY